MTDTALVPTQERELTVPETLLERIRSAAYHLLVNEGQFKWLGFKTKGLDQLNPQERSILSERMLVITNQLKTSLFTIRCLILEEVEDEGLWAHHPNDLQDTGDMLLQVSGQHVSVGQVSDALAWVKYVRPTLHKFGYPDEVIHRWGTARIRYMIPLFKALLGQTEPIASVEARIEEVQERMREVGEFPEDEEHVAVDTMAFVAKAAQQAETWREFRKQITGPPVTVKLFTDVWDFVDKPNFVFGWLSDEEMSVLRSRMGVQLETEEDEGLRQEDRAI